MKSIKNEIWMRPLNLNHTPRWTAELENSISNKVRDKLSSIDQMLWYQVRDQVVEQVDDEIS